jgi:type I restriction enzyme M protein
MALKKSELYSSIWSSCDELRGGMDASQYKDYVLVLLFVKYISDKYAGQRYAPIQIPAGASFADMVALKGNPEIGDLINKRVLGPLAQANSLSDTEPSLVIDSIHDAIWANNDLTNIAILMLGNSAA